MYTGIKIEAPIFEIGFKAGLYGAAAVELAVAADRVSVAYDVPIILSPQFVDIAAVARATSKLWVFAQHCDSLEIGRGAGSVLPEAIKEAGAVGVMLNHAERRMTLNELARTISRAEQVGLITMACADSPEEARAVAQLHPNIIVPEPPELIGTDTSVGNEMGEFIKDSVDMVKRIDPGILVFSGAGIRNGADVGAIMRQGADGAGASSGIINADDPAGMIEEMVGALQAAWDQTHP